MRNFVQKLLPTIGKNCCNVDERLQYTDTSNWLYVIGILPNLFVEFVKIVANLNFASAKFRIAHTRFNKNMTSEIDNV